MSTFLLAIASIFSFAASAAYCNFESVMALLATTSTSLDGSVIGTVIIPSESSAALCYLTNGCTTSIARCLIQNDRAHFSFMGLHTGTYTMRAVALDAMGTPLFLSPSKAVEVASLSPMQESITIGAQGSLLTAAMVNAQPNILYDTKYTWSCNQDPHAALIGTGSNITIKEPGIYTLHAQHGTTCQSMQREITNQPLLNSDLSLKINSVPPSVPYASNGHLELIATSSLSEATYTFFLTTKNSSKSIQADKKALFTNLESDIYYASVTAQTPTGWYITDPIELDLRTPQTPCLVTWYQQNTDCSSVELIAVPTIPENLATTGSAHIEFLWQLVDSSGTACTIGAGPTLRAHTSGTYRVVAQYGDASSSFTGQATLSSNLCTYALGGTTAVCLGSPVILSVTGLNPAHTYTFAWSCLSRSDTDTISFIPTENGQCSVTVTDLTTNCAQTNSICYTVTTPPVLEVPDVISCSGKDLILEVSATSASSSQGQLFVTGPGCFSFTAPIALNGIPYPVLITDYAKPLFAGCYFATVVDSNGCIATNLDNPTRVILCSCCTLDRTNH